MTYDIHIMGGGTFSHVRPHLALAAPAFGGTARLIHNLIDGSRLTEDAQGYPPALFNGAYTKLWLTRMALGSGGRGWTPPAYGHWETNEDVSNDLDLIIQEPQAKVIFFSVALCDYHGQMFDDSFGTHKLTPSGKDQPRLKTSAGEQVMRLSSADKIIGRIRKERKDIFLVGFKTTAGATPQQQYEAGLNLLKKSSCNLVLANDLHTKLNMVVVPELGRYYETQDRREAITGLVNMANKRHRLTYSRTNLHKGKLITWTSDQVPATLRRVVDHCVDRGAYKAFNDVTVGHFGFVTDVMGGRLFTTSRRKQNYNVEDGRDLVIVEMLAENQISAYGAKPSAGTVSQMKVLEAFFPKYDCIVHFHCPLKPGSKVTVRPQHDFECGSHECGQNTLDGMTDYGNVAAVMLDQHGPNVIFNREARPEDVIAFIEENFDLTKRNGDD